MLQVSTYSTDQIIEHIPLLEQWCRRDYIRYPYLWVPSHEELCMDIFVKEKDALVTLVRKQGNVLGVAAGIVFNSKLLEDYFQAPLVEKAKEQGFDPARILYMSFFLTAPEHRNDLTVVSSIYQIYIDFAKKL